MTNSEIIQALVCCKHNAGYCPDNCPLRCDDECTNKLAAEALDFINRQQAEIELMNFENLQLIAIMNKSKAEAIKEFAEAFKVKFAKERYRDIYVIDDEMLDNLVKEMVGETE